jgi:hypothetical protein
VPAQDRSIRRIASELAISRSAVEWDLRLARRLAQQGYDIIEMARRALIFAFRYGFVPEGRRQSVNSPSSLSGGARPPKQVSSPIARGSWPQLGGTNAT